MPKIILLVSQKGGVGKTTLADEILFDLERRNTPCTFYELDDQGGNVHKPVKKPEARFVVVDTPGALCADTPKWIHASDLVILPTRPSFRDIEPFLRMGSLIKKNLKPGAAAMFVINMVNPRFKATRDFMAWLETAIKEKREPLGNDYHWGFGIVPQSEMAVQAGAYGKSIVDYAPKTEIAACLRKMHDRIFELLEVE